MTDRPPTTEFGRRRPASSASSPPPKRSRHVALLVMGTLAVGGGASVLMRPENCQPISPGVASPAQPQAQATCTSRGSSFSGGHGNYSRHLSFFGGDSSSHGPSSGATESGGVSRGGFGALAHAFGFSGRS